MCLKLLFRLDEPITVNVTSSSPVHYAFHFTSDVERVLIKVQSSLDTEDVCAVASMQIASVSINYCEFVCTYIHTYIHVHMELSNDSADIF